MTEPIDLEDALGRAWEQALDAVFSNCVHSCRGISSDPKPPDPDPALDRVERLARAIGAWEWQRDPKSEETCWARVEAIVREVMG